MSHKQLLPKEVINLLREEKSIGMFFEIMNSATEDEIPRLLLSTQASRSLLKRRLYCETSTISEKKKNYNRAILASQTSLLLLSFFLCSAWHFRSHSHSKQSSYILSKQQKALNQSKRLIYFTMKNMKGSVTMISEAA